MHYALLKPHYFFYTLSVEMLYHSMPNHAYRHGCLNLSILDSLFEQSLHGQTSANIHSNAILDLQMLFKGLCFNYSGRYHPNFHQ